MHRFRLRMVGTLALALGIAAHASFVRPVHADETKHVTVITMVDTPQLVEVKDGILKGLAAHGYVEGKNLKVNFKSAQSNFGTAQQIARQFIGEAPDVIVAITT